MITRTYAYNAPALTRERVDAAAAAGSVAVAQVPASPPSPVAPAALVLVDGSVEPVRPEPSGAQEKSAPAADEEPHPAEPDPSLSEHYGKAVDLLAGLRRTDRQLTLSPRDVRRLAPYVVAWSDNGVGRADVIYALTADLPAVVRHLAGFLARRLRELLPPSLPSLVESSEATAQGDNEPSGPHPMADCEGGCDRAFRAPWPGAWRRDCRTAGLLDCRTAGLPRSRPGGPRPRRPARSDAAGPRPGTTPPARD
ncbi:hypothetical protein ABT155_27550 [Streptomyces hirsutus]|uniref:hypothetical protein n=1 Tax=Streptomyces hirsutus TaxID=35620 RepID=UPI00332917E3